MSRWTLVVPVKGTERSKSRLGGTAEERISLARAMALDSVAAAVSSSAVADVVVVTSADWSDDFAALGARVVVEGAEAGLGAAIARGIQATQSSSGGVSPLAVMLGDVPALTGAELGAALDVARDYDRAMVADREGTGTVLVASRGGKLTHAFGAGSAAAHRALGFGELDVPVDSGLRCDVDTLEQLELIASRVGHRTRAEIERGRLFSAR